MKMPKTFTVRGMQLTRRINLRSFPSDTALSATPMMFPQKEQGYITLFRYGVAVFINIPPLEQQHLIDHILAPYMDEPFRQGEEEDIEVVIDPGQDERVHGNRISLRQCTIPRLQIVAEVVARSVLLASYETRISRSFGSTYGTANRRFRSATT